MESLMSFLSQRGYLQSISSYTTEKRIELAIEASAQKSLQDKRLSIIRYILRINTYKLINLCKKNSNINILRDQEPIF
jgi:hypothetical protein